MRGFGIKNFGGPDQLEEMEVPVPDVGPEDVLVAVRGAGVGPWDVAQREGWTMGDQSLPLILGWESAGVVERVGSAVEGFEAGDEVYAYAFARGNYAEYVASPAAQTARKPVSLGFEQAAAVPVSGITAHQAICEDLDVKPDETVLINGAAGGTGVFAVQIAAARAAHVIVTASERSHGFLRRLGASECIDYRTSDIVGAVRNTHPRGVDCLLDCVGGDAFARGVQAVRDGGRAAGIAGKGPTEAPPGVVAQRIHGRPDGRRLADLSALIDDGRLAVEVQEVFELDQAARAHEVVGEGHVRGKIVLRVGAGWSE